MVQAIMANSCKIFLTANSTKFELKPMVRMAHTNGIGDLFWWLDSRGDDPYYA
jgi:DeoR/GlpR family transcriptional regulator of sugar metabolism